MRLQTHVAQLTQELSAAESQRLVLSEQVLQYQNPGNAASATAATQLQLQQLQNSCSSERESARDELSDKYSAQIVAEGKAHAAAIDALKAQTGANFTCFASTKY